MRVAIRSSRAHRTSRQTPGAQYIGEAVERKELLIGAEVHLRLNRGLYVITAIVHQDTAKPVKLNRGRILTPADSRPIIVRLVGHMVDIAEEECCGDCECKFLVSLLGYCYVAIHKG